MNLEHFCMKRLLEEHFFLEEDKKSARQKTRETCSDSLQEFMGIKEGDLNEEEVFFYQDALSCLIGEMEALIAGSSFETDLHVHVHIHNGRVSISSVGIQNFMWFPNNGE